MIKVKGKILSLFFIGIFTFLSFNVAHADVNPEINYQGKLTNTSDAPVADGYYNLQFRLCADSNCSSVLWTEIRTSTDHVLVTNGLFSVLLGSVTSLDGVDFNQPVYLELQVAGETLLPRKLLGTVPAAFEANKLNGLTSSSFAKLVSDETVTGAWTFNNILSVNNLLSVTANSSSPALNILQTGDGAGISIGNGSVTTSIFAASTSTFNYGATFASMGGAVTIGTTTPSAMLTVAGDVNITGSYFVNGLSAALPSGIDGQTMRYGTSGWEATSSLYIDNNGNIGIGTTTPNARLQVNGTSDFVDTATFSSTTNINDLLNNPGRVLNPVQAGLISASDIVALNNPNSIFVSGDYAYVADSNSSSLEILNISKPSNPVHVGVISDSLMSDAFKVFVSGKYAYVISDLGGLYGTGGLTIIDVSNPASPIKLGTFQNGVNGVVNFTQPTSIFVSGRYAYVAVGGDGRLVIIDVSNPNNPVYASEVTNGLGLPTSVFVSGKYVYITGYSSSSLDIMDISDPTNPLHVGRITNADIGGASLDGPTSVFVSGNYAYVTDDHSPSLEIIDVSNPASPTHAGIISNGGQTALDGPNAVVVSGKYAYVSSNLSHAIEIVDVSNPTAPVHASKIVNGQNGVTLQYPRSIFLSGNYLYATGLISGVNGGVAVFDVSGAIISNSEIGTAKISNLSVVENADFNGGLNIKGGLNVGTDGIFLNGGLAFAGNGTSTLNFTNAAVFKSDVSVDSSNAFILNASNFTDTSTGYLLSLRANNAEKLRVTAGGILEAGGLNVFGSSAFSGDLNINTGALLVGGNNVSQYFINGPGSAGQLWQSTGAGGQWVDTSTLGISGGGGGGSLPSGTNGQTMRYGYAGWEATNALYIDNSGNIGINTSSPGAKLHVNGDSIFESTSTFHGSLVSANGLFNSNVGVGSTVSGGSGGVNLFTNPSFEASPAISNWDPMSDGSLGSSYNTFTSYVIFGYNAINLHVGTSVYPNSSFQFLAQTVTNTPTLYNNTSTVSFYAIGRYGGETARFLISANDDYNVCGVGGSGYSFIYNFNSQNWECYNFSSLSSGIALGGPYTRDYSLTNSYVRYGENIAPISIASSSHITYGFAAGFDQGSALDGQDVVIDAAQLEPGSSATAFDNGVGTSVYNTSTAFTLDATNFSSDSGNDNILSVRSGGNEKLSLTAGGNLILKTGLFSSSVVSSGSGGTGQNLLTDSSFEISTTIDTTTQPWKVFDMQNPSSTAYLEVTSTFPNTGSHSVFLSSGNDLILLGQHYATSTNGENMTLSFYASNSSPSKVRVLLFDDNSCGGGGGGGGGGPGKAYNFDTHVWSCGGLDSLPSVSSYLLPEDVNGTVAQHSVSFIAPTASGFYVVLVLGSSDHVFDNQTAFVDDVTLTAGAGSATTAFTLNATNFSTSSVNDVLLSVKSGGDEKLSLTAGGNLSLLGSVTNLGTYISQVPMGAARSGNSIILNGGFESSLSTTTPWQPLEFGGTFEVTSSFSHAGSNALYLDSGSGTAIGLMQIVSSTGPVSMTASFYGAGAGGGNFARIAIQSDTCIEFTNNKWTYNFASGKWDCFDLDPSVSDYLWDYSLSDSSFTQKSFTFTSLPFASSTQGISFTVLAGGGPYNNQRMVLDDFSLTQNFPATTSTAFSFDAAIFATTSVNDTLLSIRSGGVEKLNLTSGGNLSFAGKLNMSDGVISSDANVGTILALSSNLISNHSFEDTPSTSSWSFSDNVDSASASITSMIAFDGTNSALLQAADVTAAYISQTIMAFPSSVSTTLSFYGAGQSGGEIIRIALEADSCGGSNKFHYNFSNNQWECSDISGFPEADPHLGEVTMTNSFVQTSLTFMSINSASSTGGVKLYFSIGSNAGSYMGTAVVDDISMSYYGEVTERSAFDLNAKNLTSSSSGYLLTVSNADAQKFSISNDGTVRINTTSTVSSYKLLIDAGSDSSGGIGVNGFIKASGFISGSSTLDLAETYPINENCMTDNSCPDVGDVICTDKGDRLAIKKCSGLDQDKILGVVSGKPGMVLGGSDLGINTFISSTTRPIALAGRVPVKVVLSSGTIEIGDELTISSSTIGVAEKSTEPGRIIGIALQSFGSNTSAYPQIGTVLMYVNPHYSVGNIQASDISDEFPDFSQTILDKFTLSVKNSLRKLGIIIKDGILKVKEIFVDRLNTNTLCVGGTCITESQLRDLLNKNNLSPTVITAPQIQTSTTQSAGSEAPITQNNNIVSSLSSSTTDGITSTKAVVNTEIPSVPSIVISEQPAVSSQVDNTTSIPVIDPPIVLPPIIISTPPVVSASADTPANQNIPPTSPATSPPADTLPPSAPVSVPEASVN